MALLVSTTLAMASDVSNQASVSSISPPRCCIAMFSYLFVKRERQFQSLSAILIGVIVSLCPNRSAKRIPALMSSQEMQRGVLDFLGHGLAK